MRLRPLSTPNGTGAVVRSLGRRHTVIREVARTLAPPYALWRFRPRGVRPRPFGPARGATERGKRLMRSALPACSWRPRARVSQLLGRGSADVSSISVLRVSGSLWAVNKKCVCSGGGRGFESIRASSAGASRHPKCRLYPKHRSRARADRLRSESTPTVKHAPVFQWARRRGGSFHRVLGASARIVEITVWGGRIIDKHGQGILRKEPGHFLWMCFWFGACLDHLRLVSRVTSYPVKSPPHLLSIIIPGHGRPTSRRRGRLRESMFYGWWPGGSSKTYGCWCFCDAHHFVYFIMFMLILFHLICV